MKPGRILIAGLVVFAAACEKNPTDGGEEGDVVYSVTGSDMGRIQQNVWVRRDGEMLTTAEVRVNGVLLPAAQGTPGRYAGPVPAIAVGDPVELEVRSGDDVITALDVAPEAPSLTAPADGTVVSRGAMIPVIWQSGTNPDRFVIYAQYSCGADCGTAETYEVAGNLRAFDIPADDLPVDRPVAISVFAYNDDIFSGPATADSRMNIRGEDGSEAGITVSSAAVYRIVGSDLGPSYEHLWVYRDGERLAGAEVRINGVLIPDAGPTGKYSGQIPWVAHGDLLDLEVRYAGELVRGTGSVPQPPELTSPADGASIASSETVPVSWTSPEDPTHFTVWAQWQCGATCWTGKTWEVDGAARSLDATAADLPVGQPIHISVFAYNDGAFSGVVTLDSELNIRGENFTDVVVTITN